MQPKNASTPKLIVLGDIFLLVGAIPSLFLPILGFASACIQLRYKEEYVACLTALGSDDLTILRVNRYMQGLCYIYSICYFGFVYRPLDKWYARNSIGFIFVNFAMIITGLYGFASNGRETCNNKSLMYNRWQIILSGLGLLIGLLVLVISIILMISFSTTGSLPSCCNCTNKVED